MRAHRVVLSPPYVAQALFSPHLDSPLVTPVPQVMKNTSSLTFVNNDSTEKQAKYETHYLTQVSTVWRIHLCRRRVQPAIIVY